MRSMKMLAAETRPTLSGVQLAIHWPFWLKAVPSLMVVRGPFLGRCGLN
jgi:hypothetical protein